MASRDMLFEKILNDKPSLAELCEHVPVSPKWYQMGVQLELDPRKLNGIEKLQGADVIDKMTKMYELWLNSKPHATRREIVETLKKKSIEEITLAEQYVTKLSKLNLTTTSVFDTLEVADEASSILQHYYTALSQSLIYPVKVSQLLYSKRCISEITLDEMEATESSADNKKILLTAVCTAVSLDHLKLKTLAGVLSKFEEMRSLGNKILSAFAQKFPDNEGEPILQEEVLGHQMSPEDCASDILCYHYGTLSQYLHHPNNVAQLLCQEKVISDTTLSQVQDNQRSQSERKTVLLKALRSAVHIDHHNLEVFASVLKHSSENAKIGEAIFSDYVKTVMKDKVQIIAEGTNISNVSIIIDSSSQGTTVNHSGQQEDPCKIPIPRSMSSEFTSIRTKFGITFNIIRHIIKSNPPPLEDMKEFLEDCDSSLRPSLAHCESINDLLNVVRDKCTLIDINYLEAVVTTFNIEGAKTHIESYKETIDRFCQYVSVRLCLEEIFPVTAIPPCLKHETATFILNWDPDDHMLNDITNLLSAVFERLHKWVTIKVIKEGNSIVVTCTFPLNLLGLLIDKAEKTILSITKKGLITLTIGHCIVWKVHTRDEKIQYLEEEVSKRENLIMELKSSLNVYTSIDREGLENQSSTDALSDKLKILDRMSKAKTLEIERLTTHKEFTDKALIDKQEEIGILQEKITLLILELKEREGEISQLMEKIKSLQSQITFKCVTPEVTKPFLEITADKLIQEMSPSQVSSQSQERETQLVITNVSSSCQAINKDEENTSQRDTGSVHWTSNSVILTSSTVVQCKEMINQLKIQRHTRWCIELRSLFPDSLLTILTDINECQVRRLVIRNTHFDSNCVHKLVQVVTCNKTMEELYLFSSPLIPDTYNLLAIAVSKNNKLKVLYLFTDNNITDNDIPHICDIITNTKTLEVLYLTCPNITKFGIQQIQNVLVNNKSLIRMFINGNYLR